MEAYLIKSILCLLVLWGFYKIALEQTAAHRFKRFYLLGSLILALVLPALTFSYTVEVEPNPQQQVVTAQPTEDFVFKETPVQAVEEPINWSPIIIGAIYAAGILLFGFRFIRNLYRIREKVKHNEQIKTRSHTNVLLPEKVVPHSFLNYIFLPKTDYKNNAIAPEILTHEQAHVTQKHSWDILFIEVLHVVFWFNPVFILFKKSIALNHEFLADRAALSQNRNVESYTNLLFTYSGGAHHTALSSPINYSLTKKRILMLSKTRSVKKLATRIALFVPVLALCIYFFNQEIVAKPVILEKGKSPITLTDHPTNIDEQNREEQKKKYKTEINSGGSVSKDNITAWIDQDYEIGVDAKDVSSLELKQLDPKSFILYQEVTTTDSISGDFVYGRVSLITKDYSNFLSTDRKELMENYRKRNNVKASERISSDELYSNMLSIQIFKDNITVNDTHAPLDKFVWIINNKTTNWTQAEQENFTLRIKTEQVNDDLLKQLNEEFKKTQLYKNNSTRDLLTQATSTQNEKILNLKVTGSRVWLNEEETSVENFAKDLDALSKDWTLTERKNFNIHVRSSNPDKGVWKGLQNAFETTALYKANPKGLMPPPPPPAPAAPKANSIPAPPPPPLAPMPISETVQGTPPPPPPPPAPEEMVRLAKENIYYNNKKISANKAKTLMKENDKYDMLLNSNNGSYVLIIKDKK